jgi:L-lactate permease
MKRATGWKLWLPMLGTPTLALAVQGLAYALATPLCQRQAGPWLHALFAAALVLALLLAQAARGEARRQREAHGAEVATGNTDRHGPQHRFLAEVALGVAGISALALLAMWIVQASLSPCLS